jgi:tetrahydromethanopterin S-methyltransferase subunit G
MLELDGRCVNIDIVFRVTFVDGDVQEREGKGGRDVFCVFGLFLIELRINNVSIVCVLFCFIILY